MGWNVEQYLGALLRETTKSMNTLPIIPFPRDGGNAEIPVTVPGSKSITNRAMILAAMTPGTVRLTNALFSEDTEAMTDCLQTLGFKIKTDKTKKTISVRGTGGKIPAKTAELFVATAGTTARFLTAMLALSPDGVYKLDGSEVMRKRPMKGLLDALEILGCEFEFHGERGCFPFTMRTHGVLRQSVEVDASASSQILSALMLIAPAAGLKIRLAGTTVSRPFLNLTAKMIAQFGGNIKSRGNVWTGDGGGYQNRSRVYKIEPDATAASYFAVRAIANGVDARRIFVKNLRGESIQGDTAFFRLLEKNGFIKVRECSRGMHFSPAGTLPKNKKIVLDFNAVSDTFLSLAAFVPLLPATVKITGIAHTRAQESDRVHAMAVELAKIAGRENIIEEHDALTIIPPENLAGTLAAASLPVEIETYKDHRIAMSFAAAGTVDVLGNGKPWIAVKNPGCTAKTFPDFFDVLETMRKR